MVRAERYSDHRFIEQLCGGRDASFLSYEPEALPAVPSLQAKDLERSGTVRVITEDEDEAKKELSLAKAVRDFSKALEPKETLKPGEIPDHLYIGLITGNYNTSTFLQAAEQVRIARL